MRLIVLFMLLAGPVFAETRQFANAVYELPEGWRVGNSDRGYQVLISDLPEDRCEFCYIYISKPTKGARDPAGFLASRRFAFVDEDERSGAKVIQKPSKLKVGTRDAAMVGVMAGGDLQIVVAIRLADRMHLVGFEGGAGDEAALTETMAVFGETITPLLDGMTFLSEGAPGLLPEAVPQDLAGLWWGWSPTWRLGLDGMMSYQLSYRRLVVWPDGHFYDGTPPGGLAPIERAALLMGGDTDFGTYFVDDTALHLTFADGRTEELPRDGDGFLDGERRLAMVEVLADGETIDGTISSVFTSGFSPGSGVTGSVYAGTYTTFAPDGTWRSSASSAASASFDSAGTTTGGFSTNSGETATTGSYEIRDGLLIRKTEGEAGAITNLIFRAGDDIMIDDQVLAQ